MAQEEKALPRTGFLKKTLTPQAISPLCLVFGLALHHLGTINIS